MKKSRKSFCNKNKKKRTIPTSTGRTMKKKGENEKMKYRRCLIIGMKVKSFCSSLNHILPPGHPYSVFS